MRSVLLVLCRLAPYGLAGCGVVDATVGVVGSTVGAAVDVTGSVVSGTVDVVTSPARDD